MIADNWQLQDRQFKDILRLSTKLEVLALLALQLVSELRLDSISSIRGNQQHPSQETSWTNHQEELEE